MDIAEYNLMALFFKYAKNHSTPAGKKYTFDTIEKSYETLQFKDLAKICREYDVPVT
mgnify:CR=1 FL=1